MIASSAVEYCLLHYVPNVLLSDKSVLIAAIFIDSSDPRNEVCAMICAADWQTRVRILDPDADLEMLDALLSEIREQLVSQSRSSDMIGQMMDSFSNAVQVSQSRKCPVASDPEAIEAFARRLLLETSSVAPSVSEVRGPRREVSV
jgi:hypothetical protein